MIYLFGDSFAVQARDPVGVAIRLAMATSQHVRDESCREGGVREVYRTVTASDIGRGERSIVVVGARDSRGGGIPPERFIDATIVINDFLTERTGERPVFVLAPPCPIVRPSPKGFAKGSKRWLERIQNAIAQEAGRAASSGVRLPSFVIPVIPASGWNDQLTLKQSGVEALVRAMVDALPNGRVARIRSRA